VLSQVRGLSEITAKKNDVSKLMFSLQIDKPKFFTSEAALS